MNDRFQVRRSVSDLGPDLWRVWDSRDRLFLATFSREMLAAHCAERFEQEARAALFGAAQQVGR